MLSVLILCGPSGGGKSTFAQIAAHLPGTLVVSADDHFMRDGKYCFNPAELGIAHGKCLRLYAEELFYRTVRKEGGTVIVDNTNLSLVELAPYVSLAKAYKIEPEVLVFRHKFMNVHEVSGDMVANMHLRLEELLKSWPAYWVMPKVMGE
jgi:predicted kinase